MFNKIKKLRYWEFWPLWLAGTPLVIFTILFGIRSRKLFYFTNVNPAFDNSALLFSSKIKILNLLPQSCIPKSVLIPSDKATEIDIQKTLQDHNLAFPIIAKPDMGERGLLVEKIETLEKLSVYLEANEIDFLLQEYIDYKNEIGIFFFKMPDESKITITSVCLKKFLCLQGDGHSTVEILLKSHFHGKHQFDRLKNKLEDQMHIILPIGEQILIEPIGNHSRGTEFYDGLDLIDESLEELVEFLIGNNKDINYGRFDIKFNTIEELKEKMNFKVIELNGVASEPIHIYDRKYNIYQKYKTFYEHFKIMYQISRIQSKEGIKPMSASSVFKLIIKYRKYIKKINKK